MADRPLPTPLPADLPEDWTSGQIVAPDGADVGLSEQHGYNYLMGQVNAAQRALNTINEGFDGISGKRTCRFVIGTSTAGWTQADCDYLCDGTDDQVELIAALNALIELGGGEIAMLDGEYNLASSDFLIKEDVKDISIAGSPGSTILKLAGSFSMRDYKSSCIIRFYGLTFISADSLPILSALGVCFDIQSCVFMNVRVMYSSISSYSTSFRFQNNQVELDLDPVDSITSSVDLVQVTDYSAQSTDCICISGNFFKVDVPSPYPSLINEIIYTDVVYNAVIIENNVVMCTDHTWSIICRGEMVLANNEISGVDLMLGAAGTVSGNKIENGNIIAERFVTVDRSAAPLLSIVGNQITNAPVRSAGPVMITGNSFLNGTEKPAITVDKYAPNAKPDLSPAIVGNFIAGGQIGIHLLDGAHTTADPDVSHAIISSNRIHGCETPIQIDASWSSCMITDNLFEGSIVNNGTGNIIRLNSDDPGGGGSTSGVTSFKGRTGIVTPQAGDYTAAMVGARPDTWMPTAADVGAVTAEQLNAAIQAAVLDSWEGSY